MDVDEIPEEGTTEEEVKETMANQRIKAQN